MRLQEKAEKQKNFYDYKGPCKSVSAHTHLFLSMNLQFPILSCSFLGVQPRLRQHHEGGSGTVTRIIRKDGKA